MLEFCKAIANLARTLRGGTSGVCGLPICSAQESLSRFHSGLVSGYTTIGTTVV